jgi:DNA-directed RNA polymerase specialized sigma24 family protein
MTPTRREARSSVNRSLTSKRRNRLIENDEYAAFVRRVIRAYSRRVAQGDIDAITDMAAASAELDTAIRQAVTGLRAKGYSWADIATRLGVTRQAAQQRWGGTHP